MPAFAVTGGSTEGFPTAVVVTGGIKGTTDKPGSGSGGSTDESGGNTGGNGGNTGGSGGSTGGSGLIIGGAGGTTGSIGGTSGGMPGGMKNLSPYAMDTAELTVLPNRLNELVVDIVPVPTVLARKLVHRIRFCSCLTPNLNKNLPSLDVADMSVDDLRIRCVMKSLGRSWYEVTYLGNCSTKNAKGWVETSCGNSDACSHPKGTQNTVRNLWSYRFMQLFHFLV